MIHAKLPIKRLRCGACGKPPERFVEVGSISMTFDVSADGRYRDAEGVQHAGVVEGLYAVCAQGHRWRVRGAVQVTSIERFADAVCRCRQLTCLCDGDLSMHIRYARQLEGRGLKS